MGLDDRQKAFEDKFAFDEELQFKVRARGNKQIGLWAAEKMGKTKAEADDYAHKLVSSMFDKEMLLACLKKDFGDAKTEVSEAEIATNVNNFTAAARKYFMEQIQ